MDGELENDLETMMDNLNVNATLDNLWNRKNGTGEMPILTFKWTDYTLFGMMLGSSCLIGIYFGCFGKKQIKTEYLLGGRRMGYLPVSLSIVAAHVSGITMLGMPAETYKFGALYWMTIICSVFVGPIVSYVYLPVFYKLKVISSYEYLKLRFSPKVRIFASFLFTIAIIFYLPLFIYMPALAFAKVTGFNVHFITPVLCIICIFYTSIGGIKAVIWTDSLQFSITLVAMFTVFCLGINSAGGILEIWNKSLEGGRLDIFVMDPDPTIRISFWNVMIGFTCSWVSYCGTNQSYVQKFLSVPTLSDARKTVALVCIGIAVVKTVCISTGLIIYTKYSECDPLTTGAVEKADELLPYYVMDVAGDIYGMPGLFVAGVVCAALSSLSAYLNTLSGTIYEDFICPYMPKDTSETTTNHILKTIVVIAGIIGVLLVFVIEHLGGILQLTLSLEGITAGPLLGLFTLGMLFPFANTKGALAGGVAGLVVGTWIVLGTQYHIALGNIKHPAKPLSADNCDFFANVTTPAETPSMNEEVFFLYRISFLYYSLIGTLAVLAVGIPVSLLTRNENDPEVDMDLLSPVVHGLVKRDKKRYYSVEKALHIITKKDTNEKDTRSW